MNDLVAVTTIRQGSPKNSIEKARAAVFLDTADALQANGIPCVALHTACTQRYLACLKRLGVILIAETDYGMGPVRRQAWRVARETHPTPYYLWVEPEKPDLPRFARRLQALMAREGTCLGMFARRSLKSYPEEQALYYAFCRAVATKITGFRFDYGFGPMIIANDALGEFLSYDGEYGDR